MGKVIDFSKSVYEICKETPEVIAIMRDLGFESITNPTALKTVGRFMTIPKGAAMKNISINDIKVVQGIAKTKKLGYTKNTETKRKCLMYMKNGKKGPEKKYIRISSKRQITIHYLNFAYGKY